MRVKAPWKESLKKKYCGFTLQQSLYNATKKTLECFSRTINMQQSSTSLRCQALPLGECGSDSVFTTLESNLWLEKSMLPTSPGRVSLAAAFHSMSFIIRWTSRQDEWTTVIFMLPNQLGRRCSLTNRMGPQKNCIRGLKSQTQLQWQTSNMTMAAQLACVFAGKPFTNTLNLAPISCTLAGEGYHSLHGYQAEPSFWLCATIYDAAGSRLWRVVLNVQRIQFNGFGVTAQCTMKLSIYCSGGALISQESNNWKHPAAKQKKKSKNCVLATCSSPVGERPCEVDGLQFPWATVSHWLHVLSRVSPETINSPSSKVTPVPP